MTSLEPDFYSRSVVDVARDLVGCIVLYRDCAGRIVETEAYHQSEPACHAYVGRTPRTETLFGAPGTAYVYRSYGLHNLLNAVCEPEGTGAAALIRALEPISGLEQMRRRRGTENHEALCSGPGKLTQALEIGLNLNGSDLADGPIQITPPDSAWNCVTHVIGTRIGITRAVDLPWRFCLARSRHVSRPWPPRLHQS